MIDFSSSRSFNLDVPITNEDFISRKHRYRIYRAKPRNQLVYECFKLSEAYIHLRETDFLCDVCLVKQFLGADGFFHSYSKEYFKSYSNQFSLTF